ncbi:MAG: acyl carrier protein [bacterium]
MIAEEVRTALLDIIAEIVPDEDVTNIKGDVPIREQIELDSMDFLDIVMEIRKRYQLEVPEENYQELNTLDSSVAYLTPKLEHLQV